MTLPNFLIIGAAKSGTTSLYYYLKQHPDVFMSPVKEPNFFAVEGKEPGFRSRGGYKPPGEKTTLEEYEALFAGVTGEKAIGEASPMYLRNPEAPARIQHHVPEAKLVAVLRNPVERAYSAYLMVVRNEREERDFARALERGEASNLGYVQAGFYHAQLSRYYELFDREQIRVYLYEDLKEDPTGMVQDVFRFLEVDDSFAPDVSLRHNTGGVRRSGALYGAVHSAIMRPNPIRQALKPLLPERVRKRVYEGVRERVLREAPPLSVEQRRKLVELYREDIVKLEGLIGRDLSGWLDGGGGNR
jgi:Sulfotransferase domain